MDQIESVLVIGVLFGVGLWLLLEGQFLKSLLGLVLFSNATNLFLLLTAGDPRDKVAPLIGEGGEAVDPLPQALILTAIVIGFGVLAYTVFLLARVKSEESSGDAHE